MSKWNRITTTERCFAMSASYLMANYTIRTTNPDEVVRAAVLAAEQRRHARKSAAAKKKQARRVAVDKIDAAALALIAGKTIGPRNHCYICGRSLDDPQSVARAIGSECSQGVLNAMERRRAPAAPGNGTPFRIKECTIKSRARGGMHAGRAEFLLGRAAVDFS
jgi:predicted nucleic acid-binding Zn ribbon protein